MHLDMSTDTVKLACGGTTDCINARHISWKFLDKRPEVPGVTLPDSIQFAWHCAARFPWFNPLIVYNLENGISAVTAGGEDATMNSDLAQQWAVPTAAVSYRSDESVRAQTVSVEVADLQGKPYGTFEVELDPSKVKEDCSGGKFASPASATGASPVQ
jgi:hypothetical protein